MTGQGVEEGLEGVLAKKKITFKDQMDALVALGEAKDEAYAFLREKLMTGPTKFYLVMEVCFEKDRREGGTTEMIVFLPTDNDGSLHTLLRESQIEDFYQISSHEIVKSIAEWQTRGTGWRVKEILSLHVETSRYKPNHGSSYLKTPKKIGAKGAIVNVINRDSRCFEYSILAAMHYDEIKSLYKKTYRYHPSYFSEWIGKELDMSGLSEPVEIDEIGIFEKNNQMSVNVWLVEENGVSVDPLRISEVQNDSWKKIDLLLIEGKENCHYTWIKDLNRLLRDPNNTHKKHFCRNCGTGFDKRYLTAEKLELHKRSCNAKDAQRVRIVKDKVVKFTNWAQTLEAPVAIYADFECFNKKISSCEPPPKKKSRKGGEVENSFTEMKTLHEVSGYAFTVVSPHYPGQTFYYRASEGGMNAAEHFLQSVEKESLKIQEWIKTNKKKMNPLSAAEVTKHRASTHCHICKSRFLDIVLKRPEGYFPNNPETKIRDHDHFTGEYRGPAHNHCNLMYRTVKKIPLFIHNLKGYDATLIMQQIHTTGLQPSVLARNLENFISFDIGLISFRDSFQHLATSLATLVTNLKKNLSNNELKVKFSNLWKYFSTKYPNLDEKCFELLTRKLPFPYAYFDTVDCFKEEKLPAIEMFRNDLTGEELAMDEYIFLQDLWKKFGLVNLGELQDLYVVVDTLLLADVFENYRKVALATYRLDPAHFMTAPSLSWSAALLYTGVQLEIPQEPEMHDFIDLGIRGGVSQVSQCHAEANNLYMGEEYDPQKPDTYIMQMDCNNLYGKAMMQHLPRGKFEWAAKAELEDTDTVEKKIRDWPDDAPRGCILEVDLDYPHELFEKHDGLPLAPENAVIDKSMLTSYQLQMGKAFDAKIGGKKLCLSLTDKKNYITHYRNLKYYLSKGLRLRKVHQALMFEQSDWLKGYVELNTSMRKTAPSQFQQDFAKLMNNSFFGKTAENKRNHSDVRVTANLKTAQKILAKPRVRRWKGYGNHAAFLLKKTSVVLDRPRYVGFSILELSKLELYGFHYDYIIPIFGGSNVKTCHLDTDSFTYHIESPQDVYDVLKDHGEMMDFSNYPDGHRCRADTNKLQPGYWKDEAHSRVIRDFIGLRAKMYSILYCGGEEKKTAKGVLSTVRKSQLRHEQYRRSLFEEEQMTHRGNKILKKDNQLYTVSMAKSSLCPFNDKIRIERCGSDFICHSLGYE